ASGAYRLSRAVSLPITAASSGSWRRRSWSLISGYPSASPMIRCPTRVATLCSIRSGLRRSVNACATRSIRRIALLVLASSSAPPSDVISPPSKPATIVRPSTLPKSSESGLQCVGIGRLLRLRSSRSYKTTFSDSAARCRRLWWENRANAVQAFPGRAGGRLVAFAPGLGLVGLRPQLALDLAFVVRHERNEAPVPLMPANLGKTLPADRDQPGMLAARGPQHD